MTTDNITRKLDILRRIQRIKPIDELGKAERRHCNAVSSAHRVFVSSNPSPNHTSLYHIITLIDYLRRLVIRK